MKRATLIRMVIVFALLLVVVSIFAARTFAASANNTQARQCAQANQTATQKAKQDLQAYDRSVVQLQQALARNLARDKGKAQKVKQDQQLYVVSWQKNRAYYTQLLKKNQTLSSACQGQNSTLTLPPIPTAPSGSSKGLTPPPLPTQPPTASGPMEPGRRHRPMPPTPTPVPTQPPVSTQPPAPTPTQPVSGGGNNQQLAAQLFALINSDRAAKGLPAYTLNSTLSNGAYQHDVTMASPQCGALMHQCPGEPSPSQRVTNEGIKWMATGENIGEASYPNAWQGIQAVHQQMVNEGPSGGHYQNLFSSTYHQCGIGILIDAKGTVWITEDFTN
jgi:uncharacterized protein YkwD